MTTVANTAQFIVAYSLALVFFGCCAHACCTPTEEDIVGEWIPSCDTPRTVNFPGHPDLKLEIIETPRLTFSSNGTFLAENIHERILLGPWPDSTGIISTTGKWKIVKDRGSYRLILKASEDWGGNASFETQMEISKGFKGGLTLYFLLGDPDVDNRFYFEKKCW